MLYFTNETISEIKKTYRKLCSIHHPDRGGDTTTMQEINELLALNLSDIEIALVGVYVWVSGETKAHKAALKALKCRWHSKRKMWYWKDFSKKARYNKNASFSDMAAKYGYTSFNSEQTAVEGR